MIRFRNPSAHALRDALEQWLEEPAATSREGDTPIPVDIYQDETEIIVAASLPGLTRRGARGRNDPRH